MESGCQDKHLGSLGGVQTGMWKEGKREKFRTQEAGSLSSESASLCLEEGALEVLGADVLKGTVPLPIFLLCLWGTIFLVTFWLQEVFKFQNRIVSLQQESSGLGSAREAPAVHGNRAVPATDQTVPKGATCY